jgi:hypothetical protein
MAATMNATIVASTGVFSKTARKSLPSYVIL